MLAQEPSLRPSSDRRARRRDPGKAKDSTFAGPSSCPRESPTQHARCNGRCPITEQSVIASSNRDRVRFRCRASHRLIHPTSFKKWAAVDVEMRSSRAASILTYISRLSLLMYTSVVMYSKICTSEGQIPSKSPAINVTAIPTSFHCLRVARRRSRYLSIIRPDKLGWLDRCQRDLNESRPYSAPQMEDALVTMLTCESSTADIIRHTTPHLVVYDPQDQSIHCSFGSSPPSCPKTLSRKVLPLGNTAWAYNSLRRFT